MDDWLSDPVVVFDHASRVFRRRPGELAAVSEATASVESGARIALVGPSGSGKTTLLYLAAGLDSPSKGSVSWPALGDRASLRPAKVSLVFQGSNLIAPLTTEQNVALPLLMLGTPEGEAGGRALAMLEDLGLGELAGRLPHEISGGQAQRVAMARALVVDPRLLLADEPTGQMDHATATRLMEVVLAGLGPGTTMLLATHDPSVAAFMDEVWTMRGGRLEIEA
jgi:ABC-type lipoprotein export system ATPase subunit